MSFDFIKPDNPLLRTKLENFDFSNPPEDPEKISLDLIKKMNETGGLGLSANQLGLPYRVFSMRSSPNLVCFNPRIVSSSEQGTWMEEGCLSFPNLIFKAYRANKIRVRFTTPNGNIVTKDFEGMTSRIFQHEMDHMDGKYPFEGIGRIRLDKALRSAEKLGSYYRPYGLMKYA